MPMLPRLGLLGHPPCQLTCGLPSQHRNRTTLPCFNSPSRHGTGLTTMLRTTRAEPPQCMHHADRSRRGMP